MPGQVHFYTLDCILRQFCCASLAPTNFRLLCGGQLCHYHDKQPIVVSLTPPLYAWHRCHPLCLCSCWLSCNLCCFSPLSLSLSLFLGTPAVASSFLRRISSCSLSGEVEFQSDQSSIQFCGSKLRQHLKWLKPKAIEFLDNRAIGYLPETKRQQMLINLRENCTTLTQKINIKSNNYNCSNSSEHKAKWEKQLFMHLSRVFCLGN